MPLMTTAIAAICVSAQASYGEACNKAFDAGTRQVGLRQTIDVAESRANELANAKVQQIIGREGVSLVGSGFWVYKVARDKTVVLRLPTLGICDSANNEISVDSYKLNVNWKF